MLQVYKLMRGDAEMQDVYVTKTDAMISADELHQLAAAHGLALVLPAHEFDEAALEPHQRFEIENNIDTARQWTIARAYWFFDSPSAALQRRQAIETALSEILGPA